jgi:Thaumarchaeal output domain 1
MIQLTGTNRRKADSATDYFRAVYEQRMEVAQAESDEELLLPGDALEELSLTNRKNRRCGDTVHDRAHDTIHGVRPSTMHDAGHERAREKPARLTCERRTEPRHKIHRALVAVPVLIDGFPDRDHRVSGRCLDLSSKGIGMELQCQTEFPTTSLVLTFPSPNGEVCSAAMEIRYMQPNGQGGVRVGGLFGGYAEQILFAENLSPTFDQQKMEFALRLPEEMLNEWAAIGVLRPVLLDRVQLCPKCRGLPTFRRACPSCGSASTTNDQLIHHFACAHVGFVRDFDVAGELICPKCRTRALVIGSDYEYMTGPYRCLDCQWGDMELEQVAHCLRCAFRFPGHQAHEQELRGYRANRLDPLALLAASESALDLAGRLAADGRATLCVQQDHLVPLGQRA